MIITGILVRGNEQENNENAKVDPALKASSGTDSETLKKEEEAINIDGLNQKQINELREKV